MGLKHTISTGYCHIEDTNKLQVCMRAHKQKAHITFGKWLILNQLCYIVDRAKLGRTDHTTRLLYISGKKKIRTTAPQWPSFSFAAASNFVDVVFCGLVKSSTTFLPMLFKLELCLLYISTVQLLLRWPEVYFVFGNCMSECCRYSYFFSFSLSSLVSNLRRQCYNSKFNHKTILVINYLILLQILAIQ